MTADVYTKGMTVTKLLNAAVCSVDAIVCEVAGVWNLLLYMEYLHGLPAELLTCTACALHELQVMHNPTFFVVVKYACGCLYTSKLIIRVLLHEVVLL